jgi:transcription antitermination factor NusG
LLGVEAQDFSRPQMVKPRRTGWYAVQTRSRFEKAVRTELTCRGIENYLPEFAEIHQWKDRKKTVTLPLFPGYVFARFEELGDTRLEVLRTHGVVRILGNGSAIEPILYTEIASIQKLLRSGNHFYPYPFVRKGSWVRVRRGPLCGLEGRLIQIKSETRLVLSVDLLSRSVATEVYAQDIEPARDPRA